MGYFPARRVALEHMSNNGVRFVRMRIDVSWLGTPFPNGLRRGRWVQMGRWGGVRRH